MLLHHQQIYDQLMNLVKNNESFYFVDQELESKNEKIKMRIFLYRIASYTDFLEPSALEARGIMFQIDENDKPIRLACRPFKKFFNYNECPFTMNLDLSKIDCVMDKLDGSLISTYMVSNEPDNDEMRLKTKGSLHSEQAIAAMNLLNTAEYAQLKSFLQLCTNGYDLTVNLEFTSPTNRIVIGYEKPALTILSIRDNFSGNEYTYAEIVNFINAIKSSSEYFNNLDQFLVKNNLDFAKLIGLEKFPDFVESMTTNIEGFVVKLSDGNIFKLKTQKYRTLHKTKDNISSSRKLYEAVVLETADDLKAMLVDDEISIKFINDMIIKVKKIYKESYDTVYDFYNNHKNLSRKDYAIAGQKNLDRIYFSQAMNLYLGKEVNWQEFLIKNYDIFGIKNETLLQME